MGLHHRNVLVGCRVEDEHRLVLGEDAPHGVHARDVGQAIDELCTLAAAARGGPRIAGPEQGQFTFDVV